MHHQSGVSSVDEFLALDQRAIDRVLELDADGLLGTCARHDIHMCGVRPAAVLIAAAIGLGAGRPELIEHTTSLDFGGRLDWVVGYAGIAFPAQERLS